MATMQSAYATYQNSKIMTATPAELTLMLYEGAIKFCNIAIMGVEQRDIQKAHNNIRKVQNIICSHYQDILIYGTGLYSQKQVPYSSETGLVGKRTVINDRDRTSGGLNRGPLRKEIRKSAVGDYYMLVYFRQRINILYQTTENGCISHFKKRFGEILGKRIQTGGITCRYYNILHYFKGLRSDIYHSMNFATPS